LRKAWELDDAAEAERLIRELARRMEKEAPGVSGSILEGRHATQSRSPKKSRG
jgi:hypothetical protein